jgi:biopolymer transport protein TolR
LGMTTGGGGGYSSDINVTPMIDVLLVLLIIFMVIVPVTPKGLNALVPQPSKDQKQNNTSDRTIVVQVIAVAGQLPQYKINETSVQKSELLPKLTEIYANRAEKVMFVKGDDDLNFSYIAEVIDIGKQATVDNIGIMTPKIMAGQ